jgi:hemoglobin-like flavoprotein
MSFTQLQAQQLILLEYSFDQIKTHRLGFAADFYNTLLNDYPQVQPLFSHGNIASQYDKLMNALSLVIQNLRTPDILMNSFRGLGARHVKYGVLPEHYPLLGKSLLKTFATYLDSKWTLELELAWAEAYSSIVEIMLEGAEYSPQVLQIASNGHNPALLAIPAFASETQSSISSTPSVLNTSSNASPSNVSPVATATAIATATAPISTSEPTSDPLLRQPYGRPLAEILADLSKPVPSALMQTLPTQTPERESTIASLLMTVLDYLAPGWEGFVTNSQIMGDRFIITYRITLHAAEGTFNRESLGTSITSLSEAETKAFVSAVGRWGLGVKNLKDEG